jgi:SAM-dependent methyltransferase
VARLNLGVGTRPDLALDVVNVDQLDLAGVNVVWNLDVFPWPWPDESFADCRALHVYEHLTEPVEFMREAWRVLEPGALLHIVVPHWQSENAFTDPTHVRYCTERTWDYWIHGTQLHAESAYCGGVAHYTKADVYRTGDDIVAMLRKDSAPC